MISLVEAKGVLFMSAYNVQDVANWMLSKGSMSPKKLQKMIYYAYAWVLTLLNDSDDELNNKLFEEKIEAWVHGPVVHSIYEKYSKYGYESIPKFEDKDVVNFSDDIEDILNQVWEVYSKYSADELESLTHQESPWKNARSGLTPLQRSNVQISDKDIYDCYIQRVN